ncbi:MAG TPA: pyridoxamine 5'-phosphate oxidase [Bacteroidales bacterium]|nr:pyridoxamine 5'-phosphate oxidase [Bacteroidales bacterium]
MKEKLSAIRQEYHHRSLDEKSIDKDPFRQLETWLSDAIDAGLPEPNAMILSTISKKGGPSSRVVLLKGLSKEGLIFYTNYHSRKASELKAMPEASVVLFWPSLERQVRVEGKVAAVEPGMSDRYFAERPRNSQIGAWASPQSEVIPGREFLEERYKSFEMKFAGDKVKRPPHWGGYRLSPASFEFWQGAPGRLHDRLVFESTDGIWAIKRLAP